MIPHIKKCCAVSHSTTVKPKPVLVVKITGLKNLLVSDKDFHKLSKICRPTANLLLRSAIL